MPRRPSPRHCGPPGEVATLILPADVSWSEGGVVAPPVRVRPLAGVPASTIEDVAAQLRSQRVRWVLLGGKALREPGLRAAARIAAATGAELLAETFAARIERGAGIPEIQRLAYFGEMAAGQLEGLRHLILVDARAPVSFFAYPASRATSSPRDVT